MSFQIGTTWHTNSREYDYLNRRLHVTLDSALNAALTRAENTHPAVTVWIESVVTGERCYIKFPSRH